MIFSRIYSMKNMQVYISVITSVLNKKIGNIVIVPYVVIVYRWNSGYRGFSVNFCFLNFDGHIVINLNKKTKEK